MTPIRLTLLLLAWMLVVTAACALLFLPTEVAPTHQPRRTRAPMDTRP